MTQNKSKSPGPELVSTAMKKPKLNKAEKKHLRQLESIQLKKQLIKDQLLREIELTKKSLVRGKVEWEKLCKEIKLKEFREEVEAWGSKAQRLLEKKDTNIKLLVKNIDETEELHERNLSQFIDQLKYLTKCHKTLRETATSLYSMQASEMIQDFLLELNNSKDNLNSFKLNTENISFSTNVVTKDKLRKNYEHYMERKFDEVTSEIEKRYILRDATVKKMKNLQDYLFLWIRELQSDMLDVHKSERFLYFMARQQNYIQESNRLNEVERVSRKTILELEQELLNIESESNRKIYGLKLEQEYFLEVRSIIKNSIERDNQVTHEKMLAVASESYRLKDKLKKIVRKGELLLSLGVCCRKHQTENEKIIPWNNETHDSIGDTDLKMVFDFFKHLDITEEELADQMSLFKNFWRRCSNVRFHNVLLLEEKLKLTEENEKYRNIIRSMK